jgi:hypothetical protein
MPISGARPVNPFYSPALTCIDAAVDSLWLCKARRNQHIAHAKAFLNPCDPRGGPGTRPPGGNQSVELEHLATVPLVLSQHFLSVDRAYQDVEGALYHYPRQYFGRVTPFASFVYYRPGGGSVRRPDERHYFGYGVVGVPYPDSRDDHLRFVDVIRYDEFFNFVPLRDPLGNYYETGTPSVPQGQSAVREINDVAYHRILAAAGVAMTGVSLSPTTLDVEHRIVPSRWPTDDFRQIDLIPPGAGYVPKSGTAPNVYEAAALQERARADHQRVLALILREVQAKGGSCLYNNNVDLLARFDNNRLLVEAKSLNDLRDAVDRMRYGMGQLMDYGVRYRAELDGATPMLAFGRAPAADAQWIGEVLEANGVAFTCVAGDALLPLNDLARRTALFSGERGHRSPTTMALQRRRHRQGLVSLPRTPTEHRRGELLAAAPDKRPGCRRHPVAFQAARAEELHRGRRLLYLLHAPARRYELYELRRAHWERLACRNAHARRSLRRGTAARSHR